MPLPTELPLDITASIGQWGEWVESPIAVEAGLLDYWCAVLQDGNPAYWDEAYAASSAWKTRIAPPSACLPLTNPLPWRPPTAKKAAGGGVINPNVRLREQMGLGGVTGLSMDLQWRNPVHLGDRLSVRSRTVSIEGPVTSGVGEGYKTVNERESRNQRAEPALLSRFGTYSYKAWPLEPEALAYGRLPGILPDLSGYVLPVPLKSERPVQPLEYPMPALTFYKAASVMRDWNLYHVDTQYVRANGGIAAMYPSLLFEMALLNRFATAWSGPEWNLRRLQWTTGGLIHPGNTVRIEGVPTQRYAEAGEERVDIVAVMRTEHCTVLTVELTLARMA